MLYFAAALFIIIALKYLSSVFVYLILSVFITILFSPLVSWFEKKNLPTFIGYIASLLIFLLIFGIIFYIVDYSSKQFIQNIDIYKHKFTEISKILNSYLNQYDLNLNFQSLNLIEIVKTALSKAGVVLKGFLIVFIGVSFLLFEQKYFYKKLTLFSDKSSLNHFITSTQKYFIIKTFTSFLTGLFVAIMLFAFDVPYAMFFGILAFFFNFIPVIGSIIAAIPGILMALITYDIQTSLYVTVFYIIINTSISNVLEPKIMGDGLNLSPAVVFFSLLLWGWVFGIVGMFLAVPLTMTLKIALESSEKTKKWAMLLSQS